MDTNILNLKCVSVQSMMIIYIKQHLSNILSSIYDKVNTEAEFKKSVAYTKKCVFKILARSPKNTQKRIHSR